MTGKRPVEETVTLTSPYGSKVTVSASGVSAYTAAGYKPIEVAPVRAAPKRRQSKTSD